MQTVNFALSKLLGAQAAEAAPLAPKPTLTAAIRAAKLRRVKPARRFPNLAIAAIHAFALRDSRVERFDIPSN
jgi:hypothetical protein